MSINWVCFHDVSFTDWWKEALEEADGGSSGRKVMRIIIRRSVVRGRLMKKVAHLWETTIHGRGHKMSVFKCFTAVRTTRRLLYCTIPLTKIKVVGVCEHLWQIEELWNEFLHVGHVALRG